MRGSINGWNARKARVGAWELKDRKRENGIGESDSLRENFNDRQKVSFCACVSFFFSEGNPN